MRDLSRDTHVFFGNNFAIAGAAGPLLVLRAARAMDILYHWSSTIQQLSAKHMPLPPLLLVVSLIMDCDGREVARSVVGYHTRYGAVILFGLTIAAAFALHDFWHYTNSIAHDVEFDIFTRDCGDLRRLAGHDRIGAAGLRGFDQPRPLMSAGRRR